MPRICASSLLLLLIAAMSLRAEDSELKQTALKSVQEYTIHPADKPDAQFQLVTEPLVRFATQNIDEGDILIWTRQGRPEVAAQVFQLDVGNNKIWLHEFQSLSSEPIVLERGGTPIWSPAEKGMTWNTLPADFAPGQTAPLRLTQMKQLARRFTGVEQSPGVENRVEDLKDFELRMKPKEVFRYASKESGTADGVVFYFAQEDRTDPELLLLIEAATVDGQPAWRFACAPLSCWSMQLNLDGKEAVSIPSRYLKSSPTEPYHIWGWN
jgi:hypothetical protein